MSKGSQPCSVERVDHEILERKLLMSLSDESKVALVIDQSGLDTLINALRAVSLPGGAGTEAAEMLRDLKQLRREAFGK